jgi:hypothetical protein
MDGYSNPLFSEQSVTDILSNFNSFFRLFQNSINIGYFKYHWLMWFPPNSFCVPFFMRPRHVWCSKHFMAIYLTPVLQIHESKSGRDRTLWSNPYTGLLNDPDFLYKHYTTYFIWVSGSATLPDEHCWKSQAWRRSDTFGGRKIPSPT